jgi:hypothetical protein
MKTASKYMALALALVVILFTAYRDGKHTEGVVCCTVLFPCYEVK